MRSAILATLLFLSAFLIADEEQNDASFHAFTGRVSRSRVRMRMQPTLDSPIVKEMDQGELVVVVGDGDEFFAVLPPKGTKAYISRRYVLDGVVEGNHVNVRLEPTLESPVIAQLDSGHKVEGDISPLSSKWLEINPPENVHFFISKDLIEKVGDPSFMASQEARREDVNRLLSSTYMVGQAELQKSFHDINLEPVYEKYRKVISEYSDFPDQAGRARELMEQTQEKYLQKKIAYLEHKAKLDAEITSSEQMPQTEETPKEESKTEPAAVSYAEWAFENQPQGMQGSILVWIPVEKNLYEEWLLDHEGASFDDFYKDQEDQAILLTGILQPYNRSVRNKPGDFILLHRITHLPIAYLYSTRVNLKEHEGKEVTLRGAIRPNNNFAYPAYYILSVD